MVKQLLFTLLLSKAFILYSVEPEYYFDLLPADVKAIVRTFSRGGYEPLYCLNLYFLVLNNDHVFLKKYGELTSASLHSDRYSNGGENNALVLAKKLNRTECIDFFKQAGVDRDMVDRHYEWNLEPRILLELAIDSGYYQAACHFMKQTVDINMPINDDGFTFLMSAALNNRITIAKLILDAGANPDARTKCQNCKYRSYDLDYQTYRGPLRSPCLHHSEETALSIATKHARHEMVALILECKKKKEASC